MPTPSDPGPALDSSPVLDPGRLDPGRLDPGRLDPGRLDAGELVGLLADDDRRKVVAALVLGATTGPRSPAPPGWTRGGWSAR